jgi:hypothetical protein
MANAPTDVLKLGGISFGQFSTPEEMMGGGNQAMVVHKLPGGNRVIDTLGPDEANITWSGFFFGNNAYANALALDGMRAAGQVLALTWGGQYRSVIIDNFVYRVRRMPVWVKYAISCTVYQNPALGNLSIAPSSFDTLVSSDLESASTAASGSGSGSGAGTVPDDTSSVTEGLA